MTRRRAAIVLYSGNTFSLAENRKTATRFLSCLCTFSIRIRARAMASDRSVERRIPRDAAVVINVLRSMGVEEWEPRVVNQLMEFVHRTSTPP
jgi:hypothetical protein